MWQVHSKLWNTIPVYSFFFGGECMVFLRQRNECKLITLEGNISSSVFDTGPSGCTRTLQTCQILMTSNGGIWIEILGVRILNNVRLVCSTYFPVIKNSITVQVLANTFTQFIYMHIQPPTRLPYFQTAYERRRAQSGDVFVSMRTRAFHMMIDSVNISTRR